MKKPYPCLNRLPEEVLLLYDALGDVSILLLALPSGHRVEKCLPLTVLGGPVVYAT